MGYAGYVGFKFLSRPTQEPKNPLMGLPQLLLKVPPELSKIHLCPKVPLDPQKYPLRPHGHPDFQKYLWTPQKYKKVSPAQLTPLDTPKSTLRPSKEDKSKFLHFSTLSNCPIVQILKYGHTNRFFCYEFFFGYLQLKKSHRMYI